MQQFFTEDSVSTLPDVRATAAVADLRNEPMSEKLTRTDAATSAQKGGKKGFVARAIQSFVNSAYNSHYMPHM